MARNYDSQIRQEVFSHFSQSQYVYLATMDKKTARVRPMTLFYVDHRFWMVTFHSDAKLNQIHVNKGIEICYPLLVEGNQGYIRAKGTVKVVHDANLRNEAALFCYFFDDYFDGADDPEFILLEYEFDEIEYMRPGESDAQSFKI